MLCQHPYRQAEMKIVLWGTYDTGKPRVRLLREGIQRNGFELIECHTDIWGGIEDKSQIVGISKKLSLMLRILACYPGLILRYLRLPAHDLVLISYPGLFDVLLIRIFAWLRRVPVAWDVFISTYDTVVEDRHIVRYRHPVARLLWGLEWLAIRAADWVFMDTRTHAIRLEKLFSLSDGVCGSVWVGVEIEKFTGVVQEVVGELEPRSEGPLRVLFYGQFIPLHGIEHVVAAARLLRDVEVEWLLIGKGQEASRIREMLADDPLSRLNWMEWVDYSDLMNWIDRADICLGIFGTSEKAGSVIPNKVYQIVAARKPLITRDSPAIRELLNDSPPCTYLIPAGDARALANIVERHAYNMQHSEKNDCHTELVNRIDATAIGAQFREFLFSKRDFGPQK